VGYLAKAWRLADGDLCRALTKYRAGHGSDRMSALSIEYCRRARQHLAAVGAQLGTQVETLLQPAIRTQGQDQGKDIKRKRPARRTVTASKAPRLYVRERISLSRFQEAERANRDWSKKHRVDGWARKKDRLKLAMPKSRVASR
jgi:hypothetical protein